MDKRNYRLLILAGLLVVGVIGIKLFTSWQQRSIDHVRSDIAAEMARLAADPIAPPTLPPIDPSKPIRLAIGPLGPPGTDGDALVDILTAVLSAGTRFDLVERRELDRALAEAQMSHGSLVRAAEAVRVGHLVRADWFLLGGPGPIGTTNALLVRLVDARSSVLREAWVLSGRDELPDVAEELRDLVQAAAEGVEPAAARTYLAMGHFVDLSLNDRLAGFPEKLKAHLVSSFQDRSVILVERELVSALLREVELDLAGLTAGGAANAPTPVQSAFWVVDGYFQSTETPDTGVDLVLRVERVLGGQEQVPLRGAPDEAFLSTVRQAIDVVMAKGSTWQARAGLKREAWLQIRRGIEFARMSEDLVSKDPLWLEQQLGGGFRADPIQSVRQIEQAIVAFQSALLLDPENREAMMYLATCLRHPAIDRRVEARGYYQRVMAGSQQDRWTSQAPVGLAYTLVPENLDRAIEVLRSAGLHAWEPHLVAYARRLTGGLAPAARPARSEAEEDERIALEIGRIAAEAERDGRVRQFAINQFMALQDRTINAARVERLLPEWVERHPRLEPYLLADAVMLQVDTNAALVRKFVASVEACADQPERLLDPQGYFHRLLEGPSTWAFNHRRLDLVVRLAEVRQRAVDRGLAAPIPDRNQVQLGYAYLLQDQWQKALPLFQGLGNRSVRMDRNGPWGHFRHPVSAPALAQLCRERLGLPRDPTDRHTTLQRSNIKADFPVAFDVEGDVLWVAGGVSLMRYDHGSGTQSKFALPLADDSKITVVCAAPDMVWIGTHSAGLLGFDKRKEQIRQLRVSDGLLLDAIASLHFDGDTLWIGYGDSTRGGLGRWDADRQRITTFLPGLEQAKLGGLASHHWDKELDPLDGPPRHPVNAIVSGQPGNLWLAVQRKGIQHFDVRSGRWATFASASREEWIPAAAADARMVAVGTRTGSTSTSGPSNLPQRNGGLSVRWPGSTEWTEFTESDGLPLNEVTALTLDGDTLWVGGPGYLALIDVNRREITRTWSFSAEEVTGIRLGITASWFSSGSDLYWIPPGKAPVSAD
jgi:tetratricopeptide (TPR) repeat protein